MIGKTLNRLKYIKQKLKNTPRYQLTERVREFIATSHETKFTEAEKKAVLRFLSNNLVEIFNYSFSVNYHFRRTKIYKDAALNDLRYVITNQGKKLYFRRNLTDNQIREGYNNLCLEQDTQSPHYYDFEDLGINGQTILADIGSAEGNFSLSVVEKVKKIYLFETEDSWMEPLQATFKPWSDKIEIIKKYVSDSNTSMTVTLDSFFKDKEIPNLYKIDVEGAEESVVKGGETIFANDIPKKILLCTYHKNGDFEKFTEWMHTKGYRTSSPEGYVFFHLEDANYSSVAPFDFRKGLILGVK